MRARRRWLAAAGVGAALALALPALPASAHAFLVASDPGDGATLEAAPSVVHLSFSESVDLAAMEIDIVDSAGRHVAPTGITLAGDVSRDLEDPVEVVATLPPLGPDAYRMSWRTLSSDDLHATEGIVVFGVGRPVTAAGFTEATPGVSDTLWRAGVLLGFTLALGGWVSGRLLRQVGPGPLLDRAVSRSVRLATIGAALGLTAAVGQILAQIVAGAPAAAVFSGAYGGHWLLREAGLVLLLLAVRRRRSVVVPTSAAAVTAGAVTAAAGEAWGSHAGASGSMTRIAADLVHLLAAATWAGTVIVLVTVALPWAHRGGAGAVTRVLRAFGPVAASCVGLLAATGLFLAAGLAGSVDAVLRTVYGQTLLVKLLLVAVIGVLGLFNVRAVTRQRAVPGRTLHLEAAAAAGVLVLVAALTGGQPAMEPDLVASAPTAGTPEQSVLVDDLQETVSISPGAVGPNVVLIGVADTRRPSPGPVASVVVELADDRGTVLSSATAARLGGGNWSAPLLLDRAAGRTVTVRVDRAGMPQVQRSYPWTATTTTATGDVVVSTAPIAGLLRWASGAAAVLMVLAGLAWWRRTPWRDAVRTDEHRAQPEGGTPRRLEPAGRG